MVSGSFSLLIHGTIRTGQLVVILADIQSTPAQRSEAVQSQSTNSKPDGLRPRPSNIVGHSRYMTEGKIGVVAAGHAQLIN